MKSENPYQTPAVLEETEDAQGVPARQRGYWILLGWTVVFSLNLIVPLCFGSAITSLHGRLGMAAAVVLYWLGGCVLCLSLPEFAKRMMISAMIFAATQVFPILQIVAGMIALNLANLIGFTKDGWHDIPVISSELGGFAVTCLVGGMLTTLVALLAWFSAWLFPEKKSASGGSTG